MPRYLLVSGCARSGTSALTHYLNRHPDVALGLERYNLYTKSGGPVNEALFLPERFLDIRPGDTFYKDFSYFPNYEQVRDKYRRATIVGDKVPKYYLRYNDALKALSGVKFIYILRNIYDVAASYKVSAAKRTHWPKWRTVPSAIEDWNLSLQRTLEHAGAGRVHIVPYEEFFLKGVGARALWKFLELDPGPLGTELAPDGQPASSRDGSPKVLDAFDTYRIAAEADFDRYRALLSQARIMQQTLEPGSS